MSYAFLRSFQQMPASRTGLRVARLGQILAALTLALVLAACTVPAPQTPARVDGAVDGTAGAAAPAAPPAVETPTGKIGANPGTNPGTPPGAKPGAMPAAPDRSCRTDSDCAVKDVGNCCGYFPMCVNKNAQTDPAAVRAACEREGIASTCGFQEVKGCRCVENRCENLRDGLPEAM